ncbi:hypothetical protein PsorP6_001987 [Peronosclerospora sorghi]|uniref:Uncharacterized protein n=1 Tax=Peronosclerospora sorghi TaxID=230839 RepID=A0ACC0WRR5_9STRA|nr:hypothetical protein PsorP6_001987 [Peronosclerospora sorghi]
MRNLHSLENNQSDEVASKRYEQQVVCVNNTLLGLTLENTIVKSLFLDCKVVRGKYAGKIKKNGMLKECLREQKHAKEKVMKACKHVKQKLQDLGDRGLRQMLLDIGPGVIC